MRAIPLVFLTLVVAGILVGCSKAADDSADAATVSAASPAAPAAAKEMDMAGKASSGDDLERKLTMGAVRGRTAINGVAGATAQAQLASNDTPEVPRMIVRNGELTLRVKEIRAAEKSVGAIARAVNGAVEASQDTDSAGPDPGATITLRVPESKFDDTLDQLEAVGARLSRSISSEDVTTQAVDMDARLKSLRVQEEAYRAILAAARKISDVLEVQEKLTEVRTEIEQIVAQRRNLGDQAARSKIVVTLTQLARPEAPAIEQDWASQSWGEATGSLRSFGRSLAQIGIWGTAMIPVWLPVGLIGAVAVRRRRRG